MPNRSVRLRPWQKAALESFRSTAGPDFLAVATPGAGKTTFALTVAVQELAVGLAANRDESTGPGPVRRVVVVAPTAHLKTQWARAATDFGLHLDPAWSAVDGGLPADMHGIVTTYQQVATSARTLRGMTRNALIIFDEIHHAGDDRAWGEAVRHAFENAPRRLSLSGTPFRSDTRAIPFIRYNVEEAEPDFEYGYGQALADRRVVRPVYFPRTNGHMEWSAPDGSLHEATFDDALDQARANQRLRTALSLEGDWLPAVLRSAHERLLDLRRSHPEAGGLVIATDQDHAKGVAELLEWHFRVRAVVATSDDPRASARITDFATSTAPWLVAVRMVSEGVDIPRLRVGVYATTTTTELFFRQAVGRFVRWTPGLVRQPSYLFIPDDVRLRARAFQIADLRRHSLRKDSTRQDPDEIDDELDEQQADGDQLSLFSVISAVATDADASVEDHLDAGTASLDDGDVGEELVVELGALPPLRGATLVPENGPVRTLRARKEALRAANADLARYLSRRTGWPHARVNAELNRLTGLRRVTEATVEQLERRLQHGKRWLSRS